MIERTLEPIPKVHPGFGRLRKRHPASGLLSVFSEYAADGPPCLALSRSASGRRSDFWDRFLPASLLLAAVAGCSPAQAPGSKPAPDIEATKRLDQEFQEQVAEFNRHTGTRQLSAGEVRAKVERGEQIIFLDIREPEENAVSSLPEAQLIPPGAVSRAKVEPAAGGTIVTYCTVGYRSGLAAVELEKRLGRPVYNLTGGIIAWFNAGGAVRDTKGNPTDRIHPYSEEWAKYVHPR